MEWLRPYLTVAWCPIWPVVSWRQSTAQTKWIQTAPPRARVGDRADRELIGQSKNSVLSVIMQMWYFSLC